MSNEVDIVIIRTLKTKKGGSMMTVGIKSNSDKPSEYARGLTILDTWYDDERAHNIDEKYFLKPLKATIGFRPMYNGNAKQYIDKVYDETGLCIMG